MSVKDVAAAAGVSLGTVSNVLNRPERVAPSTRVKVESAIIRLGFVRNESARALRSGRARALTYVMLDAANPFFTDVAQGIESAAVPADLSLFLCSSYGVASREASYLLQAEQQRVQGILITPVDATSEVLETVAEHDIPVVLVDGSRTDDRFCSVAVDDAYGGRLAAEHLIDRGHRRLAFVGDPDLAPQVRGRLQGARHVWSEHQLPADDLTLVETPGLTIAAGRSAVERLAGMPARTRPTAAFCANDLLALGVLQQAVSNGIRVPQDLAIVGYDDIEFASAAVVPISSVRQPRFDVGRTAAELVLAESTEPDHTHRQVLFDPELVARASSLT